MYYFKASLALSFAVFCARASADVSDGTLVYKGAAVCGSDQPCSGQGGYPACRVTLTYQDGQLKQADIFGIGDSSTGDHGYFGIANRRRGLPSDAVKVITDDVATDGDEVSIKFVVAGLRWNAYRDTTTIRLQGLTGNSIDSVVAQNGVSFVGVRGLWTKIRCAGLTRAEPEVN